MGIKDFNADNKNYSDFVNDMDNEFDSLDDMQVEEASTENQEEYQDNYTENNQEYDDSVNYEDNTVNNNNISIEDYSDQQNYDNDEQSEIVDANEQYYEEQPKKTAKQLKKEKKLLKSKKNNKNKGIEEASDKNNQHQIRDVICYIVTDKPIVGLIDYIRDNGLNATAVYSSISEIRDVRLIQFNLARIVVIDSGTGKFITPTIRKELLDFIGMADEETMFTVFYTDDIIKSDAIEEIGKTAKDVEWVKYTNTIDYINKILEHTDENYIIDKNNQTTGNYISAEDILRYKGKETPGIELEKLNRLSINIDTMINSMKDVEDGLVAFNIKY